MRKWPLARLTRELAGSKTDLNEGGSCSFHLGDQQPVPPPRRSAFIVLTLSVSSPFVASAVDIFEQQHRRGDYDWQKNAGQVHESQSSGKWLKDVYPAQPNHTPKPASLYIVIVGSVSICDQEFCIVRMFDCVRNCLERMLLRLMFGAVIEQERPSSDERYQGVSGGPCRLMPMMAMSVTPFALPTSCDLPHYS